MQNALTVEMVEFRNFGFVLRGAGLTTVLPIVLHTKVLLEAKKNVWLIQSYFNLSQNHLGIVKEAHHQKLLLLLEYSIPDCLVGLRFSYLNLIDWQGWPLSPACFSHTLPLRVTNSRYGLLFAELAIGIVVTGVRLGTRWVFDKRGFYWDDLFLILGTIFWTLMTVTLYLCTVVYNSNVGLNDKSAMMIPEDQVPSYRTGSICAFIAWISYILSVWAFKAALVFLYNRLTSGTWQHKLNLAVAGFTICTFIASLLFDLCHCRPIARNWQVKPYAGDECSIRPLNYIVIEVLSIVTDLGIMAVPIPLIMAARIPLSQKIILTLLLCSGVFVVICAILRAYYSVTDISTFSTALGWASRECFVSVLIVCAPGIKPLFTRFKWFRSKASTNDYSYGYSRRSKLQGSMLNSKKSNHFNTLISCDNHELSSGMKRHRHGSSNESQEQIISSSVTAKNDDHVEQGDNTGIQVTTDVTLEHEDAQSGTGGHPRF